jgi:hypothetical protein
MTPFWDVNIGAVIEVGVFLYAALAYRQDRKKDVADRAEAREKLLKEQVTMHQENKTKLDHLGEFHTAQLKLNGKRDEQFALLMKQTGELTQIAKGLDRRLELMENSNGRHR